MKVIQKSKHENKFVKNIKYNCKPLYKYEKSQTKIHKNVATVKDNKTGELTHQLKDQVYKQNSFNLIILWSTTGSYGWTKELKT